MPRAYPGLVSASLEYSLVARSHERAAQQLAAAGLTFLAHGSLGQGILSGKYPEGHRFGAGDRRSRPSYRNFHGERLVRNARIVEVLRSQARELSASPSQLAIAWVLHAIPESVALVGIKRAAQLSDALGALRLNISREALVALDQASAGAPSGAEAATP